MAVRPVRPVDGRPLYEVALMDTLEDGSGYCRHLSEPESLPRLPEAATGLPPGWASRLAGAEHADRCDGSCYDCLRDYSSADVLAVLDWRLALDLSWLAADAGADISVDHPRWSGLARRAEQILLEISPTTDDVRAAAEQLVEFHDRFATLFGRTKAQDHAYTDLKGLMCCPERKSIEPIASCIGDGQVSGLLKFIGVAPWAYEDVRTEAQAVFVERFAAAARSCPVGVVGVVDESAFAKKGTRSAGVARQYDGRRGKQDNCQVGVFLIGVAPEGVALLDHQLDLHQS